MSTVTSHLGVLPLPVARGGTGAGTFTTHGLLVGEGTSAVAALGAAATGTVLAGVTGADPAFTTSPSVSGSITAGTGITSTTGNIVASAGSINAATDVVAGGNVTAIFGSVSALEGNFSNMNVTFTSSPLLETAATTGDIPTGATGDTNLMAIENGLIMEEFILGAGQTIIAPRMSSTGLLTSLDLTNAEGAEYNFGAARTNSKFKFTANVSPAFFIELTVNAADIGGLDPFVVGFRKSQANDATLTNYTDFACIGARSTTAADVCVIQTQLNTGGAVITNTTDAWLDGTTKTFRVNVSSAGVVTYLINGIAPTATAAFTFDASDVVVPFIRHTFGAATPGAINWITLKIGLQ